jgi:nuclear pore complex protein Nup188
LRIPAVETVHLRICEQFVDRETPRAATTLFSWSDQLTIDGDPIYGELAILFLVKLSSIPSVAEQLALDGVLSQLSNANLTSLIRSGARPLDSNPRLYQIWARGFLPLSLNLLRAVGPLIAPEVSQFLSQFRTQLELASNNFDNKPAALVSSANAAAAAHGGHFFTLSMAFEAHSLALITYILDRFRSAGASTGVVPHEIAPLEWDAAGVKEDIEYWLARRGALRERLLPFDAVEEQMAREPANQSGKGVGGAAAGDAGASIFGADAGGSGGAGSHGSINQFEERFVAELTAVVGLLSQSS